MFFYSFLPSLSPWLCNLVLYIVHIHSSPQDGFSPCGFPSLFYILYFTSTCKLKLALALLGSLEIKSYLNSMPNDSKKLFPFCSGAAPYCASEEKTYCLYFPV